MGYLGRRLRRSVVVSFSLVLVFLVSAVGQAEETEENCGNSIAGELWLPSSGSALPTGSAPSAGVLAAAARVETEHQIAQIQYIAKLYGEFKSDFDDALVSAPAGLREVVATKAADAKLQATIAKAIQKEARLGESENRQGSNYFCAHIDDMTGARLRALLNALILQAYLTRFDETLFTHVAVYQKDADLDKADLSEATNHASVTLFNLPLHLRFLADMHRIVPMTVLSVQMNDNGKIAEAYARASQLEIRAAEEKATALAISPNVPDVLSHFMREQLHLRQALPKLATHPILIEWVRQTEEHLR